jgi:iron-sulfur cluster repair protein YtfE (RIC family)
MPAVRDEKPDVVTDALTLLKHDHRLIAALFTEFELAGPQQLDPLARRICKMLRVHTQIEEELFYPVARAAATVATIVDEAEAQHRDVQQYIVRIESLTSDHPLFLETVTTLGARMREHMAMEEATLFPQISAPRVNLVGLGFALAERRDTLMRMLGLTDDDEIPALRQLTDRSGVRGLKANGARRAANREPQ